MKSLKILVDIDGVMNNFTEVWAQRLDELYGTGIAYEDIKEWDMMETYTMLTREQLYAPILCDDFYGRLKPVSGAARFLKRLIDDGHEIFIVTHTDYQVVPVKMREFLFINYPFITWDDVILTAHKQMIRGDVLIDDGMCNLIGGDYVKLLYDAPYNRNFDAAKNGMTRVYDWEQIYMLISRMSEEQ